MASKVFDEGKRVAEEKMPGFMGYSFTATSISATRRREMNLTLVELPT